MFPAVVFWASVLGAGVGSMLPRLAYRCSVPAGRPPRADCHHCKIRFQPALRGWVVPGNGCGKCERSLGPAWPLLSGLLAATSGALAWRLAPTSVDELVLLAAWLLLASAGLLLACIDVTVRRLPTPLVLVTTAVLAGLVAVAASTARQPWMVVNSLVTGSALAGVYLLLALVGGGMGMGDVRLAGLLGLALGTAGWTAVLFGATLPYLVAIPSAVARLRRNPNERQLPFGPYLVAGAILAVCLTGG